jgi:hypothetical protein
MYYFKITKDMHSYPIDALLNYHGTAKKGSDKGLIDVAICSHYGDKKKFSIPLRFGEVVNIPKARTFTSFGVRFEMEREAKT